MAKRRQNDPYRNTPRPQPAATAKRGADDHAEGQSRQDKDEEQAEIIRRGDWDYTGSRYRAADYAEQCEGEEPPIRPDHFDTRPSIQPRRGALDDRATINAGRQQTERAAGLFTETR